MSGRDARHTRIAVAKNLQFTREVVVYAPDMYGRCWGATADPTFAITTNDPHRSFASGAYQGISAQVKVPMDRVRGTDVRFYLEFVIPNGPGGNTVMWHIDWLVRGFGNLMFVVPTVRLLPTATNAVYRITTTQDLIVPAFDVDIQDALGEPVEFFLGIAREGTHPGDTEPSAAQLHKLVMQYTAYF